jgi:hypothetical protein
MLLLHGHSLKADLGTTSGKDLEVVAVKGGEGARGELGSDVFYHIDDLSIG